MSIELKPCPFCGSDKIAYSVQTKAPYYHISYYCKNCNAYGPRITIKSKNVGYAATYTLRKETDSDIAMQAANKWNDQAANKASEAITEFASIIDNHYSIPLYQPTEKHPLKHTLIPYLLDFVDDIKNNLTKKYR